MYHAIIKLMNGEELITKVVNDDGSHWTFQDPVIMYRHLSPTGMTWLQCSHWLLFNEVSIVRVHKDKVLAVEKFLKEGYIEMNQKHQVSEQQQEMVDEIMVGGANTTYH